MSAHDHSHHDHGGHSHGVPEDATTKRIGIAFVLIVGFLIVEVVAGILASSLALLSDSAHMLLDAGALALSIIAIRLAAKPAAGAMTFGMKRAEILAAAINGTTLLVLGLLIVYEGIDRIIHPPSVHGSVVLIIALVGIAVNLAATAVLHGADRKSLNVQGAYLHILTDLFAFIATAIAGVIIMATGFDQADGIASLVIAATMLWASYGLLKSSGRIFMEAAPAGIDPVAIGNTMAATTGVVEVHDLHVWEITSGFPALSAHVTVESECDCHDIQHSLSALLQTQFGIDHTTLQVDHADGLLTIKPIFA